MSLKLKVGIVLFQKLEKSNMRWKQGVYIYIYIYIHIHMANRDYMYDIFLGISIGERVFGFRV